MLAAAPAAPVKVHRRAYRLGMRIKLNITNGALQAGAVINPDDPSVIEVVAIDTTSRPGTPASWPPTPTVTRTATASCCCRWIATRDRPRPAARQSAVSAAQPGPVWLVRAPIVMGMSADRHISLREFATGANPDTLGALSLLSLQAHRAGISHAEFLELCDSVALQPVPLLAATIGERPAAAPASPPAG